jgi:putative thioredoxin
MNTIFDTTYEKYHDDVIAASHKHPVLVDLWADWCPPCIAIAPVLKKVVAEYDTEISLAKIEVDEGENMKIAGKYQVRGFPTILLIQNGEEKARFSGAQTASFIENFIADNIE